MEIAELVRETPGQARKVYLVLAEDRYETRFGDGYYASLRSASWTLEEARALVRAAPEAGDMGEALHLRTRALRWGEAGLSLDPLRPGEQAPVEEVCELLAGQAPPMLQRTPEGWPRIEWDAGYFALSLDGAGGEVVWWGAEHPKGCHPYAHRLPLEGLLRHGVQSMDSTPPEELFALFHAALCVHLGRPTRHLLQEYVEAARERDLALVRALLKEGAPADQALHLALEGGSDAVAAAVVPYTEAPRSWGGWHWNILSLRGWHLTLQIALERFQPPHLKLSVEAWSALLLKAPLELLRALAGVSRPIIPLQTRTAPQLQDLLLARMEREPDFAAWLEMWL